MSSSCCFLGTAPGETKEDEETSVSRWVRETRPTELTDRDAGDSGRADGVAPVTMDDVMAIVRNNVVHVRQLIELALPHLP